MSESPPGSPISKFPSGTSFIGTPWGSYTSERSGLGLKTTGVDVIVLVGVRVMVGVKLGGNVPVGVRVGDGVAVVVTVSGRAVVSDGV